MPTLLITGANRGLGLEFARQYAHDGWNVIAACRHPDNATNLKALASAHPNVRMVELDVTQFSTFKRFADGLGITLDVLINNAGIYSGASRGSATDPDSSQELGTIDAEAWDKVMRVNALAPILLTQVLIPSLLRGGERKVINITSRMGSIAEMGSGFIAYRTSKAALNAAMKVIMHELTPQNITIINLHPGWVQTDMGGPSAPLDPEISVTGMRKVIGKITLKDTGQYVAYDGKVIPW